MSITSGLTLTVEQVAERLSLTPRHTRDLIRDGVIHGFKRGKRVWGVLLTDFENFLFSRGNNPQTADKVGQEVTK